jgi:hypothetical protein
MEMEQEGACVRMDPFDTEIFPGELRKLVVSFLGILERVMWQRTCKRHVQDVRASSIPNAWQAGWSLHKTKALARLFYRVLKEAPRWTQAWIWFYYKPQKDILVFPFCIGFGSDLKLVCCGPSAKTTPNRWLIKQPASRLYNSAPTLADLSNGSQPWRSFMDNRGNMICMRVHINSIMTLRMPATPIPYREVNEKVYMETTIRIEPFDNFQPRQYTMAPPAQQPIISLPKKQPRLNAWNYNKKNKRK